MTVTRREFLAGAACFLGLAAAAPQLAFAASGAESYIDNLGNSIGWQAIQ